MTATAATLSVDQTSYSGSLPVTLNLSGSITSSGTGTLVYTLEAGSSTPGFTFTLPGAQSEAYASGGSHTLPFRTSSTSLRLSVGGCACNISAPNILRSAQIDFNGHLQMMLEWNND